MGAAMGTFSAAQPRHVIWIAHRARAASVGGDGHAHLISSFDMSQQRAYAADGLVVGVRRDHEHALAAVRCPAVGGHAATA